MKAFRRFIVVGCMAVCLATAASAGLRPCPPDSVRVGNFCIERQCPPDSVKVGDVCIDKYEESVWLIDPVNNSALVNKVQAGYATLTDLHTGGALAAIQLGAADTCSDRLNYYGANFPPTGNWSPIPGSNPPSPGVYAVSIPGVQPSSCISWFQANQACRLSGKRLARNDEWQAAAQGTPTPGTDNGTTDCNVGTYPGTDSSKPVETGSRSNCKSIWGAFDMVGNMQEWVADWAERNNSGCANPGAYGFPGSDAICFRGYEEIPSQNFYPPPVPGPLTRGGEFQDGIYAGVFAVDTSFYPSEAINIIGFRCARSAQ